MMMKTLKQLREEFDSGCFVYADAGNGCGFGEQGRVLIYDVITAEVYGDTEMTELDAVHVSDDGVKCHYASDWIIDGDGDNPYRYRIYF
jgi:hypothetical protein